LAQTCFCQSARGLHVAVIVGLAGRKERYELRIEELADAALAQIAEHRVQSSDRDTEEQNQKQ
jgi:hypothetical protein